VPNLASEIQNRVEVWRAFATRCDEEWENARKVVQGERPPLIGNSKADYAALMIKNKATAEVLRSCADEMEVLVPTLKIVTNLPTHIQDC
jgi:hypothetical protein